jgi:hypothetical protein
VQHACCNRTLPTLTTLNHVLGRYAVLIISLSYLPFPCAYHYLLPPYGLYLALITSHSSVFT